MATDYEKTLHDLQTVLVTGDASAAKSLTRAAKALGNLLEQAALENAQLIVGKEADNDAKPRPKR